MCKKSPLFVFFLPDPSAFQKNLILVVYLLFFALLVACWRRLKNRLRRHALKKEDLREQKNMDLREISRLMDLKVSLEKRIRNYQYLETLTENLNKATSLECLCEIVVQETFSLLGGAGSALLYLFDDKTRRLELRAIRREGETQKIKEKTGDLFDQWTLRHNRPLLVEAVTGDFRFDPEKVKAGLRRPIGSLMSVPLATESNFLGILRLDHPSPEFYHADDLRFLAVIGDISKIVIENAVYFQRMQALSITDGLTGVFLKRYGLERLKEEFMRAQREDTPLSFLMLDIDHFKLFNDRFGHLSGDIVLKRLAGWLKDCFNAPGLVVSRYGGEEFCVMLPHVPKAEALQLAERFQHSLREKQIFLRRQKVGITISIGVAGFPEGSQSCDDLLRCADEALLRAKRQGRDRVCS